MTRGQDMGIVLPCGWLGTNRNVHKLTSRSSDSDGTTDYLARLATDRKQGDLGMTTMCFGSCTAHDDVGRPDFFAPCTIPTTTTTRERLWYRVPVLGVDGLVRPFVHPLWSTRMDKRVDGRWVGLGGRMVGWWGNARPFVKSITIIIDMPAGINSNHPVEMERRSVFKIYIFIGSFVGIIRIRMATDRLGRFVPAICSRTLCPYTDRDGQSVSRRRRSTSIQIIKCKLSGLATEEWV